VCIHSRDEKEKVKLRTRLNNLIIILMVECVSQTSLTVMDGNIYSDVTNVLSHVGHTPRDMNRLIKI
jgi:hypothetical protein